MIVVRMDEMKRRFEFKQNSVNLSRSANAILILMLHAKIKKIPLLRERSGIELSSLGDRSELLPFNY